MNLQKKSFNLPYMGCDLAEAQGLPYDTLVGSFGEPSVGLEIRNLPLQWCCNPNSYSSYHRVLLQICQILGEGYTIQKLDVFTKKTFNAVPRESAIEKQYDAHFSGRAYKELRTFLLFSPLLSATKRKGINLSEATASLTHLKEKFSKIHLLLDSAGAHPKYLRLKDYENYLMLLFQGKETNTPVKENILSGPEFLQVGEMLLKTVSLVDLEELSLPAEISPSAPDGKNLGAVVDPFSFLFNLKDAPLVVYNQILRIPLQSKLHRELERKKKRHEGVSSSAPSNLLVAREIESLLEEVAREGSLLVEGHFSVLYSAEDKLAQEQIQGSLETGFFRRGVVLSKNAYNQMELFRSFFPGGAVELKTYDFFLSPLESMLCFLFKEHLAENESSGFALDFTSREGIPLRIDPSDIPMQSGRISNRNKFVLGPSGSGKSFLMNSLVEQYLRYNYDVVIVDTGDSYQGLTRYKEGRYIQYSEKDPITMNPFQLSKEELGIEKMEFLSSLVYLIWQGQEKEMSPSEKSVLDSVLLCYYELYFLKKGGIESYPIDKRASLYHKYLPYASALSSKGHLGIKNVSGKSLHTGSSPSYYEVLGIESTLPIKEIRQHGKRLQWEMRQGGYVDTPELLSEALSVLSNYTTKRAYDKMLVSNREKPAASLPHLKQKDPVTPEEKFQSLLFHLAPEVLCFDSFYRFSEHFLPVFLNGGQLPISEASFNQSTFFLVLRDFCSGGKYGETLNRPQEKSLFKEQLIVFEIDAIKDNPKLFPIVTLIIMDTFIQKMRHRKGRRKALIIEEAWKAIASKLMGGYILYLYKTVRKFYGEAIVVTQELQDILSNPVVKDSILSNSDTLILLDQSKFQENYQSVASLLNLNAVEQSKIFTMNRLDNKEGRGRFKEFYLKRGDSGEVYGNEVSLMQYLLYTTEKPEKEALEYYYQNAGNLKEGLERFLLDHKALGLSLSEMVSLVNLHGRPLQSSDVLHFQNIKKEYPTKDPWELLRKELAQ